MDPACASACDVLAAWNRDVPIVRSQYSREPWTRNLLRYESNGFVISELIVAIPQRKKTVLVIMGASLCSN
jgi:hypothetical protein